MEENSLSIISLIVSAGFVVKVVMAILVLMSIYSWTVIMAKKKVLIDAGKHFLKKQERSTGIHESEIIKIAIKTLGLNELAHFDPQERIIEYMLESDANKPLVNMSLTDFANETASESPAPGGGSIAAYAGVMGVALGTMVANLSAHKRGWGDSWEEFADWAEKGTAYQNSLLPLVE